MPARGMAEIRCACPLTQDAARYEVGRFTAHGVEINSYTMRSHRGPGDQPVPDGRRRLSDMQRAAAGLFCCSATNQIGTVALMSLTPIDPLSRAGTADGS
jgi:hypothetical protein